MMMMSKREVQRNKRLKMIQYGRDASMVPYTPVVEVYPPTIEESEEEPVEKEPLVPTEQRIQTYASTIDVLVPYINKNPCIKATYLWRPFPSLVIRCVMGSSP